LAGVSPEQGSLTPPLYTGDAPPRSSPAAFRRAPDRKEDVSTGSSLKDAWWDLLRRDLRPPRRC
jgi:hypothetical protein